MQILGHYEIMGQSMSYVARWTQSHDGKPRKLQFCDLNRFLLQEIVGFVKEIGLMQSDESTFVFMSPLTWITGLDNSYFSDGFHEMGTDIVSDAVDGNGQPTLVLRPKGSQMEISVRSFEQLAVLAEVAGPRILLEARRCLEGNPEPLTSMFGSALNTSAKDIEEITAQKTLFGLILKLQNLDSRLMRESSELVFDSSASSEVPLANKNQVAPPDESGKRETDEPSPKRTKLDNTVVPVSHVPSSDSGQPDQTGYIAQPGSSGISVVPGSFGMSDSDTGASVIPEHQSLPSPMISTEQQENDDKNDEEDDEDEDEANGLYYTDDSYGQQIPTQEQTEEQSFQAKEWEEGAEVGDLSARTDDQSSTSIQFSDQTIRQTLSTSGEDPLLKSSSSSVTNTKPEAVLSLPDETIRQTLSTSGEDPLLKSSSSSVTNTKPEAVLQKVHSFWPQRMDNTNLKCYLYAVLHHLDSESNSPSVSKEAKFSLEVASQCIASAYGVSLQDIVAASLQPLPASLPEIFDAGLKQLIGEEDAVAQAVNQLEGQGAIMINEDHYYEAIQCYTCAISLAVYGKKSVLYWKRSHAYALMGEYKNCIADCRQVIQLDPGYGQPYNRMGCSEMALKEFVRARDCFQQALRIDPTNNEYRKNLARAEQALREEKAAEGQPQLSSEQFAAASNEERKKMLEEKLVPLIQDLHPGLCQRLVRIMLEIDESQLLQVLNSQDYMMEKVDEVINFLKPEPPKKD